MKSRIGMLVVVMMIAMGSTAAGIETDREWYLAGEAMQVSVTGEDAGIAYVELCDLQGLAAGVVLGVNGGVGSGVIELPVDLHSGYYVLSAYTRDKARVDSRLVAIVNPLRKRVDDDIEWVAVSDKDSLSYPLAVGISELTDKKEISERELGGHIIRARVKSGHAYKGEDICPSLCVVGKQIHYFEGEMVGDSLATFNTFGIQGRLPIVLSATSADGESLPIELVSPFAALIPKRLPHLVFHYQRSEVEARSLDMQRHQKTITPVTDDETEDQGLLDTLEPLTYNGGLYGTKPDLSYNLDEYRQFLTIREVLLEYVQSVYKRRINGVQKLIVNMEQNFSNNIVPTLVLIDGMPVYDTDQLLDYDARRIHYINIYGGQYTFGRGLYNGILSFVTRSGRLTNYPTDRNAQYLVYDFPEVDI